MKDILIHVVRFFGLGILATLACEIIWLKIIDGEAGPQWILLPIFSCIIFVKAAIPASLIFLLGFLDKQNALIVKLNYMAWVVFSIIIYVIHSNTGEKEYRTVLTPIAMVLLVAVYLTRTAKVMQQ